MPKSCSERLYDGSLNRGAGGGRRSLDLYGPLPQFPLISDVCRKEEDDEDDNGFDGDEAR